MACILLADGTRIGTANLIDMGTDGFIIRTGRHVLKAPKLFGCLYVDGNVQEDDNNYLHLGDLEVEKQVYERLHKVPGIVECFGSSPKGILLEYHPNRSLKEYIPKREAPSALVRWNWILQAAEVLMHCHEKGVLVFDIALRNFVIAEDLSLRMIDFANSPLLPEDSNTDISVADVDGLTAALDLFHLSNVIYSISTWQDFRVECAMESEWPNLNNMPNIVGLAHGYVIRNCWVKNYGTVHDLLRDLKSCPAPSALPSLAP